MCVLTGKKCDPSFHELYYVCVYSVFLMVYDICICTRYKKVIVVWFV